MLKKHIPDFHYMMLDLIEGCRLIYRTPSAHKVYRHVITKDDFLYKEQYIKMQKYIIPLTRMINKVQDTADADEIAKLINVLEALRNPSKKTSLQTLKEYGPSLDRIVNFFNKPPEPERILVLFVKVIKCTFHIQTPTAANFHFCNTFKPKLELFFGKSITKPRKPRLKSDEPPQKLPHALQAEIVQLIGKFTVRLDTLASNSRTTILECHLDDIRLPCVPPIFVNIPESYPYKPPNCSVIEADYSVTPFLINVKNILAAGTARLPKCYSFTRLMNVWEMAVRQACAPRLNVVNDLSLIFGV